MERKMNKRIMALIMSVLMVITVLPFNAFVLAADLPMMEKYNAASSGDYHKYYNSVYTVTFLDKIDLDSINASDTIASWDVSANDDYSVMAWMKLNSAATAAAGQNRYDVYIAGDGGIKANPDSSHIFYCFGALTEVNGLENFKTDEVTTFFRLFEKCYVLKSLDLSSFNTSKVQNFSYMFSECKAVESIDMSGWDTSSATNMAYMFNNCFVVRELDLSSFNTSKVTNMNRLFYNCHDVASVYVGSGWNIDNVQNGDSVFNCCYALMGGKDKYDNGKTGLEYAVTGENGFLKPESEKPVEKKYTVTYEFIGECQPENVFAPNVTEYKEGETVTVAAAPFAEGYVFSGWTTEDVTVTDGGFVISSDVHFVGSWSKLYTVTYKYDENYPLPEDAPKLPETAEYTANTVVKVEDAPPYMDKYTFVYWSTEDATITEEGKFIMPQKDVVLSGYFKIPVEDIEIYVKNEDGSSRDIILNLDDEHHMDDLIGVIITPENATIKGVTYESSDENVVVVDENGKLKAKNEGEAEITVRSEDNPGITATVTVKVKIPVTGIEITEKEKVLYKDGTDTITGVKLSPEGATNKKLIYESTDENIVKVDEYGNIIAINKGTTTIKVSSKDDPTVFDYITVVVKNPVTEIIATPEYTVDIGDEITLDAKANEDASDKELIYDSSDPSIVKVDNEGNIIAVGKGTATITVTSKDDPSKKTEIKVTVEVPVEEVVTPEKEITLDVGDKDKIVITVTPDNATDKSVTYESSDETVVKVDENGNIEAVGKGEATITVTSMDDPTKKTEIKVTVEVPVEEVVTPKKEITLDVGDKDKIVITVTPDNATDKSVTYESSDETVVKVDENGNIEAVGEGTATITVTSKDDPSKKTEIKVTVEVPVEEVVTPKKEITLDVGDKDKIVITVTPDNATDKSVTYESSDETVVKVDENGNIEAVGEGTATITVTSKDDPSKKTEIKVTVEVPVEEVVTPKKEITLDVGDKDKIVITVTPDNATDKSVTYESSDESVVKVDENGNIEAVGKGEATITVTSKDDPTKKTEIKVTVEVPVEDVEADKDEITLDVGSKDKINVTVTPDNANVKSVTYTSSDETVVKVDENGNIEAVGEGTAIITVVSKENPEKYDTVKITVVKPFIPVEEIEVTAQKNELEIGEETQLEVTVDPDDATDKSVTYESDDETVVKVDENGKVTAVGEGSATITVTANDGSGKKGTIVITVKKPVITYKVEHYKMDSSWSEYSNPDKTESFTGEAGETVNGQPVEFDGFAYNFFISDTVATLENGKETVLKLYYEPDTIGGADGKADGIPDKYQKLITFEVRNGKWDDGTEAKKYSYVTLLKDGRWDVSGEAAVVPPAVGSNPNEGYKTGSWNKGFVVGSNDIEVYIYSYILIETEPEVPTPDNPDAPVDPDEPGGSGSVIIPVKHHICFGKTDGIGWYEVSVNGGDFFPQGPNSTLEVEEGSVVVVRTQDMWIDDDFTFYVNGSKVEEIAPNTITFTVNGYMLVGALSMDVEVPDAEESLNLFEKIIKGIKDFFEKIFSIFKKK